jgi:hypothetical protein
MLFIKQNYKYGKGEIKTDVLLQNVYLTKLHKK